MSDFTVISSRFQNAILKKDTNIIEVEKIIENYFSTEPSRKLLEDKIFFIIKDKPEDSFFINPAEFALLAGNLKALELIVRAFGDPNIKCSAQERDITIMMHAAMIGDLAAVELLLSLGADPNFSITLEDGHKLSILTASIQEKNYSISQKLLSAGAFFSIQDAVEIIINETELPYFVIEVLKENPILLQTGEDKSNLTLLHYACYHGKLSIAQWLIVNGANLNALGDGNVTPLFLAVDTDNFEIVKLLVKSGADVNACALEDLSPLTHAINKESYDMAKYLESKGADNMGLIVNEGESIEEQSMSTNITHLIERFELLEEKFQVRVEGVYGIMTKDSPLNPKEYFVQVNFDVIGMDGVLEKDELLYFVFNAYNASGQLIATDSQVIYGGSFVGIDTKIIILNCLETPTRFRLYPRK